MPHEAHERDAQGTIVRFAVLTLSDTRTPQTDVSGRTAREMIIASGHQVVAHALIADEPAALRTTLDRWLADEAIDAIITNGGTGISSRDRTVPTIDSYLELTLPGFGELFRAMSFREIGGAAMLSRATAGTARGKLLAALPGSTAAVTLALRELILPQVRHVLRELRK
jgi:molybdenum cofactor biosynthesis protein B